MVLALIYRSIVPSKAKYRLYHIYNVVQDVYTTHLQYNNIPGIWRIRQHYKQRYSAVQENMPSGRIPGFATFDPDTHISTVIIAARCKKLSYLR